MSHFSSSDTDAHILMVDRLLMVHREEKKILNVAESLTCETGRLTTAENLLRHSKEYALVCSSLRCIGNAEAVIEDEC